MGDEPEKSECSATACAVCEALSAARAEGAGNFIAELRSGVLLLHPDQTQKGRLQFILKSHQDRVLEMPKGHREAFWQDLDLIVGVMREALQPAQLNVSGPPTASTASHEVWDLVPRYADEPHSALPFWALAPHAHSDTAAPDEDLAPLRRALLRGFLTVAPVRRELPPVQKTRLRY